MKKQQTIHPGFVTVTCLQTIQWNYNDSTQFIKGEVYSLPSTVYKILAKYFVINKNNKIEEVSNG